MKVDPVDARHRRRRWRSRIVAAGFFLPVDLRRAALGRRQRTRRARSTTSSSTRATGSSGAPGTSAIRTWMMIYAGPPLRPWARSWSWVSKTEGNGSMEFTRVEPDRRVEYSLTLPGFRREVQRARSRSSRRRQGDARHVEQLRRRRQQPAQALPRADDGSPGRPRLRAGAREPEGARREAVTLRLPELHGSRCSAAPSSARPWGCWTSTCASAATGSGSIATRARSSRRARSSTSSA